MWYKVERWNKMKLNTTFVGSYEAVCPLSCCAFRNDFIQCDTLKSMKLNTTFVGSYEAVSLSRIQSCNEAPYIASAENKAPLPFQQWLPCLMAETSGQPQWNLYDVAHSQKDNTTWRAMRLAVYIFLCASMQNSTPELWSSFALLHSLSLHWWVDLKSN